MYRPQPPAPVKKKRIPKWAIFGGIGFLAIAAASTATKPPASKTTTIPTPTVAVSQIVEDATHIIVAEEPTATQVPAPTATPPPERQTAVADFHARQTIVAQGGGPSAQATSNALGQIARRNIEIAELTGPVIAQSQSTPLTLRRPGLIGYRVEELTLAQATEFESNGKRITTDKVWRLTVISASPLLLLSDPYAIYINNTNIGYASQPSSYELHVIVADRSLLPEGGTISLLGSNSPDGWKVPDKLHFTTR